MRQWNEYNIQTYLQIESKWKAWPFGFSGSTFRIVLGTRCTNRWWWIWMDGGWKMLNNKYHSRSSSRQSTLRTVFLQKSFANRRILGRCQGDLEMMGSNWLMYRYDMMHEWRCNTDKQTMTDWRQYDTSDYWSLQTSTHSIFIYIPAATFNSILINSILPVRPSSTILSLWQRSWKETAPFHLLPTDTWNLEGIESSWELNTHTLIHIITHLLLRPNIDIVVAEKDFDWLMFCHLDVPSHSCTHLNNRAVAAAVVVYRT